MLCRPLDEDSELRLLEPRHATEVFDLLDRDRLDLRRWLRWVDEMREPADEARFIRDSLQRLASGTGLSAGIWHRGRFAGDIGFPVWDATNRWVEIGYWLGVSFRGKGLITRATRVMTDHAFRELGMNRVQVRCAVGNVKSRAVPERLGFRLEGTLRQAELLPGGYADLAVFGMLAGEWAERRASQS